MEIDDLTVDDVSTIQQYISYGINVGRHKYSNEPNFKGKGNHFP